MPLKVSIGEIVRYAGGNPQSRSIIEGENIVDDEHLQPPGIRAKTVDKIELFTLCLRSSGINKDPHSIEGEFTIRGKYLSASKIVCSCVAGVSGTCKHSVALPVYCSRNDVALFTRLSSADVKCAWKQRKKEALSLVAPVPIQDYCYVKRVAGRVEYTEEEGLTLRQEFAALFPDSALGKNNSRKRKQVEDSCATVGTSIIK